MDALAQQVELLREEVRSANARASTPSTEAACPPTAAMHPVPALPPEAFALRVAQLLEERQRAQARPIESAPTPPPALTPEAQATVAQARRLADSVLASGELRPEDTAKLRKLRALWAVWMPGGVPRGSVRPAVPPPRAYLRPWRERRGGERLTGLRPPAGSSNRVGPSENLARVALPPRGELLLLREASRGCRRTCRSARDRRGRHAVSGRGAAHGLRGGRAWPLRGGARRVDVSIDHSPVTPR